MLFTTFNLKSELYSIAISEYMLVLPVNCAFIIYTVLYKNNKMKEY